MNTALETSALEISRVIDATLAETWTAWTDPDLISRWFAPGNMRAEVLEYDVRPGGAYCIRMHDEDGSTHTVAGQFVELIHQQRIVMSWAWVGGEGGESTVTIEFADENGSTAISLLHEGLGDEGSRAAHGVGWEGCLDNLERRICGF